MKFPFVNMSAIWCLVSMCRIWILGSELNSVKQPIKGNSVGSWHVSHCWTPAFDYHLNHGFIVLKHFQHCIGLGKFRIRRHTVNVKQIRGALAWRGAMQQVPVLMDPWFYWIGLVNDGTLLPNSKDPELGLPSIRRKRASREIISASVELLETEVCFLHIQLIGTNVWLPKMHKDSTRCWFSNLPGRWQNQNLAIIPLYIDVQCFPYDNIVWIHLCDECKIPNVLRRLSHALVHFVMARASLFADHNMSGLPIRAEYRHFRPICEHTVWQFSHKFLFLLLFWIDGRQCMVLRLCVIVE